MDKAISIILSMLLAVTLSAQSADSSKFAALGLKLAEYYDAMKGESLAVQEAECDFLIESASDAALRQYIAQDIYDHYINSPVMGSENVAVHVFDKWFSNGTLAMSSPEKLADAKVYADFNRTSLIGKRAPSLAMESLDGQFVELFAGNGEPGRFSVLYFYDTDCSKCLLETILLDGLFADGKYPVSFYAVYVGGNREAWHSYALNKFKAMPRENIIHLWDSALDSDFHRKYGVTQTPRLFLVGPDGVILGRGLNAKALASMLDGIFAEATLEYGTPESSKLFDGIFAASSSSPSEAEVKGIADYIHDKTLATGELLMFKQLAGDYLYYLSTRSGEGVKEGMRYHIDKNILSQGQVWTSSDDSLKVVGFARIMWDLLEKALPGTRVPSLKVSGELYSSEGGRSVVRRLDKIGGDENVIIFYTEGCEVCAAEKVAALKNITRTTAVFMVNVDALISSNPALASRLMDAFDLSSLPYIIITDRKGIVLRRYVSLSDF